MKVTYIGHSGFLVETKEAYLLFDCLAVPGELPNQDLEYSIGILPEMDKKKDIVVFVSHQHKDHYERAIWKLRELYPHVKYVISKDIPFSSKAQEKLGITEMDLQDILRAYGNKRYNLALQNGNEIKIETFFSTDEGVAYYVTLNGQTIYHAGDLHLWAWEEEGPKYVKTMTDQFYWVTEGLKGRKTDVAFVLLDPRLEKTAYQGIDAYLELMDCKCVFPMHFWKQYDFVACYLNERPGSPVQMIEREGQTFEIN